MTTDVEDEETNSETDEVRTNYGPGRNSMDRSIESEISRELQYVPD
jgi:hypothetical protein